MKLLVSAGIYKHAADACREFGLKIGDTIQGRMQYPGCEQVWNDARLTLLWIGAEVVVWLERRRYSRTQPREWTPARESTSWTLYDRDWYLLEAREALADLDGGAN